MQGSLIKNYTWLDIVETLSVLGTIGGSIASVVSQQVVFASIPLSLSVTLNLVNRRLLLDSINQSNQTAVAQLRQENVETQAKFGALTEQLAQLAELTTDLGHTQGTNNLAIAQITQENVETQAKFGTLTEQLAQLAELTTNLGHTQGTNNLVIAQITQENVETQAKFGTLTEQLAQLAELTTNLGHTQGTNNLAIAQITQENIETQAKLGKLTGQLAEVRRLTTNLGKGTSNLENYTQTLHKEQTKIAHKVSCLREIETCTQAIRINPNDAQAYYNRGLLYQRLGYKEAAIWDHTEAIRINPSYAEAYHDRGLTRANLGDKKGAVKDLREAAKHFFEEGDIANYQTARDLSKNFHEISSQPTRTDAHEEVAVECLFS